MQDDVNLLQLVSYLRLRKLVVKRITVSQCTTFALTLPCESATKFLLLWRLV